MLSEKSIGLQDIQIVTSIEQLNDHLKLSRNSGKSIGFVPTMGALHDGHISLINQSTKFCDITVSSIYVNPTQFNNPDDLKKYPRTIDEDIQMLQEANCNIVYIPKESEIYPGGLKTIDYDIGALADVMEGSFRPGHFQGMVTVVKTLFEIVKPTHAFFGEKDFQQLAIIRKLVHDFQLSIDVIGCTIIRESNGLAMSSRNQRLSEEDRLRCGLIYETISKIPQLMKTMSVSEVKVHIANIINDSGFLKLDYFELADSADLSIIENWSQSDNIRAFIAVYCKEIRLIDNIQVSS
ncbi:MAG: pantoate--beta-alanine ligase [Flavobacteriales bacterium]|nr:pantoate--beta-alanine ligase [Flavobacteriales bacterium]